MKELEALEQELTNDTKDILINNLTLLDTASFRCRAICHNRNKYTLSHTGGVKPVKEPEGFRSNLREIYEELSLEQLIKIYKLNNGQKI